MAFEYSKTEENKNDGLEMEPRGQSEAVSGLPNCLVMRIMEEPNAEEEADRLSRGTTSRTPSAIRREMGSRLNADFASVRFHSDQASINRSRAMGARAWAQVMGKIL